MKLAIIMGLLAGIAGALFIIPVRLRFRYLKKENDDYFSLTWQIIPGIWGITTEIPFLKVSPGRSWPLIQIVTRLEGEKDGEVWEGGQKISLGRLLKNFPRLAFTGREITILGKWFLSKISLQKLTWSTEVGTGEAGNTGVLVGLIWALKGLILQYIFFGAKKTLGKPKLKVIPNFTRPIMAWDVDCIFDVTCGHIIIGGIKALYLLRKKGSD